MRYKIIFVLLLLPLFFWACKETVLPKPKAMLRLEYKNVSQGQVNTENFQFENNKLSEVQIKDQTSMILFYPKMKGSIFINYRGVDENLESLIVDAQKLSYEHVLKADNIVEQPFINDSARVYGMFYEVQGDAASQAQFYVTDSTNHFVTGSLYFHIKPNYDSIYPAAIYLQKDIRRIMETLRWK